MPYAPRTIAYLCELLHPPQVLDPGPIQRVHNAMFESGAPLYQSFTVSPEGAALSNPTAQPGAVSSAAFLADRFQFREELSGMTVDEFAARVHDVTVQVSRTRGVQLFTGQVVMIRTLINPRHFRDSRAFLKDGLFGFDDELEELGRQPQLFGLRLVFPPSPSEPNAFTLRVESFANDPRSIFLENEGRFGPALPARGLEALRDNVETTYRFLVERALSFLERFDVRQEA